MVIWGDVSGRPCLFHGVALAERCRAHKLTLGAALFGLANGIEVDGDGKGNAKLVRTRVSLSWGVGLGIGGRRCYVSNEMREGGDSCRAR